LHLALHEWRDWTRLLTSEVGKPLLLGSTTIASQLAVISYFVTKRVVARYRRKHPHPPVVEDEEVEP
jgi:hypothetical protein